MRVLLTGATGFIGSHLLEKLLATDNSVAILSRPESSPWRIQDSLEKIVKITGDLRDANTFEDGVRKFAPDTILHLAGYGVENRFRNDPLQATINLPGSLALVTLAHNVGVQTFIGIGSQAEYGPSNRQVDEGASTNPTTLYGATKLCTSLMLQHLSDHFNMRFVWMRLFSAYGPRDNPDWLIPYLILSLLRGECPALTKGTQRWDYLYVTDVAEAVYQATVTPGVKGVFNLGSGQACTVRKIAEQLRDLVDPSLSLNFGEIPYRSDQVIHLQSDVSKLRGATNWSPQVELAHGLQRTVKWFRKNRGCYGR